VFFQKVVVTRIAPFVQDCLQPFVEPFASGN
jgi:hypothetical protein